MRRIGVETTEVHIINKDSGCAWYRAHSAWDLLNLKHTARQRPLTDNIAGDRHRGLKARET